MAEFDYDKTVREIEGILEKVENPETGIEASGRLVDKARKLLDECYGYLKSERETK